MTKILGILNITPDSFSDGGDFFNYNSAIEKAYQLLEDGADIIDIGAQATNPKIQSLASDEEELNRLRKILPEVASIAEKNSAKVSIDSFYPKVIKFALNSGASIINDQSGCSNIKIIELIKHAEKVIAMHSLTVPPKKDVILGENALEELYDWMKNKINSLIENGIEKEKIVIDPGIGFGKNIEQSRSVIRNISKFKQLQIPILIGHSRKSFMKPFVKSDPLTLGCSGFLIAHKVDYIRVHDVLMHKALKSILDPG